MQWRRVLGALAVSAALSAPLLAGESTAAPAIPFEFKLESAGATSAGVYAADGHLVRLLWTAREIAAGAAHETWDGLDDLGREAPPGNYEVRIASGPCTYKCMGVVGNNGEDISVQASVAEVVLDRANGDVYTANSWEEYGQDFKRTDRNGKHIMNAKHRAKLGGDGVPGGLPLAIAVDGEYLYTANFTLREPVAPGVKANSGGSIICRYRTSDGAPAKLTGPSGYIRLYEPRWNDRGDPQLWEHQTILSLCVRENALFATDREGNRVLKFDKTTGEKLGEFSVPAPTCIRADAAGKLWVLHEKNKLTQFDRDGKVLADPTIDGAEFSCIALDSKGQLWVADVAAAQLRIYTVETAQSPRLVRTIGSPAVPGTYAPTRFYTIKSFDVGSDGQWVLAQTPGRGVILSAYSADEQQLWQHVGLELCDTATCDWRQPDEIVSPYFHSYHIDAADTGAWQFDGNLRGGDPILSKWNGAAGAVSGNQRFVYLGGERYFFIGGAHAAELFRTEGKALVPATILGFAANAWIPEKFGALTDAEKRAPLRYIWRDRNGDGLITADEITSKQTGAEAHMSQFCCDIDERGNILFADIGTAAVYELPLRKIENHTPVYDWSDVHQVIAPDQTLRGLKHCKVLRTPDGSYYSLQQAEHAFYPPTNYKTNWGYAHETGWMGGWLLSRYDSAGKRLFTVPLPQHCVGFDWIPNADRTAAMGLVVGFFVGTELYHYSLDGLLLGKLAPTHETGWLDTNGSINVSRNPNTGVCDVFAEDSYRNRISWYHLDDKNAQRQVIAITKPEVPGRAYPTEADFYALLEAGTTQLKKHANAEAIETLRKALKVAGEREQLPVHLKLAQACAAVQDRLPEAIAEYETALQSANLKGAKRGETLLVLKDCLVKEKQYDRAAAVASEVLKLDVHKDMHFEPRGRLALAQIYTASGKPDDARRECEAVQHYFTEHAPDYRLCFEAARMLADQYIHADKWDAAAHEYEALLILKNIGDGERAQIECTLGALYRSKKEPAEALKHYATVYEKYTGVHPDYLSQAYLQAAECNTQLGNLPAARELYEKLRALPNVSEAAKKDADARLQRLADKK